MTPLHLTLRPEQLLPTPTLTIYQLPMIAVSRATWFQGEGWAGWVMPYLNKQQRPAVKTTWEGFSVA